MRGFLLGEARRPGEEMMAVVLRVGGGPEGGSIGETPRAFSESPAGESVVEVLELG